MGRNAAVDEQPAVARIPVADVLVADDGEQRLRNEHRRLLLALARRRGAASTPRHAALVLALDRERRMADPAEHRA